MTPSPFELPADLVIVGLSLRTSMATATADIPAHWQKFMASNVLASLSSKRSADVYAVYCDYETDFRGAYTMVLGAEVDPGADVPSGMRRVRVPNGRYASFHAEGKPADVIVRAWTYVITEWSERSKRRYIADFERYRGMSHDAVVADIVVGLT